jgi:hypothetical protein
MMWIYERVHCRYIPHVERLFIALGALGFTISIVINYLDYYNHNSVLNKCSSAEYAEILTEMEDDSHKQEIGDDDVGFDGIALSSRPESD